MAKIKLGAIARTVSAAAVAGLMERGGKLRLRAAPWGTGAVLVELPAGAGFDVRKGRATLRFEDALGQAKGAPAWAQCVTADGEVVFELDVGGKESAAALQLDPLTVWREGTVSVPELVYVQPE